MEDREDFAVERKSEAPAPNKPRCYYFQTSGCSKKDCFFVHDHRVTARPPVCSFWEHGHCRFEQDCVYFHDDGSDKDVRGSFDNIPKVPQAKGGPGRGVRRSDTRSWPKSAADDEGWLTRSRKEKVVPPPAPPAADAWDDAAPSNRFAALEATDPDL